MNITIKTKKYGTADFYCPDNGGYIRLNSESGKPICERGCLHGINLSAKPENLQQICYEWMKARAEKVARGWF